MSINFDKFNEQVFYSTLRIEIPNKKSIGTGFLVRISSKIVGQDYIFLVSNKHVLDDPKEILQIVFHKKNLEDGTPSLTEQVPFAVNWFNPNAYFLHPSEIVDLACINISDLFNVTKNSIYVRTLTVDQFSDFNEPELIAGNDVVFIGYPENRYDHVHNLPILRGGRIASIPQLNFENKPLFLIDAPVYPGSSGSPVFSKLASNYKLIGIVSQTMIRNRKLQLVEKSTQGIFQDILGIGLVYKSTSIRELIEYSKFKLDRLR